MQKTIGILTGGGDAPGLNAVIRAVVKTATGEYGMNVVGIEDGFEGLLGDTMTRPLSHPKCEACCLGVELFWGRAIEGNSWNTRPREFHQLQKGYIARQCRALNDLA